MAHQAPHYWCHTSMRFDHLGHRVEIVVEYEAEPDLESAEAFRK
jgi:hypothetical protein